MATQPSSRAGVTPVVAVVLLLMMTVAAAGAAFTWFTQLQEDFQDRAESDLRSQIDVQDLECELGEDDDIIHLALQNAGDVSIDMSKVHVFLMDSSGHINATFTDQGWSDYSFTQPGGFDEVELKMSESTSGAEELVEGSFYNLDVSIVSHGIERSAGGCLPE